MTCDFTSFLTVFSHNRTMVGCNERLCSRNPRLQLERFPPQAGLEPGTARSVVQRLTCSSPNRNGVRHCYISEVPVGEFVISVLIIVVMVKFSVSLLVYSCFIL